MTEPSRARQLNLGYSISRPAITAQSITKTEWAIVIALCASASLIAIVVSWHLGALLNYGDAAAHLHIARRVFDCHQPRFSQLGSVWLPLPHILLLPFVQVDRWWANGLAGVVPSALAYIGACAGIYRLARLWLPPITAAFPLLLFAANPNLLYLQTTAMTEPLFVCEMIWITVWMVEWRTQLAIATASNKRLVWIIALALVAAIFTRYDGWIMALIAWSSMGVTLYRCRQLGPRTFWLATGLVIAAPLAWFAYNSGAFGDWLFFLRGPYSAKAIEMRTSTPGFPPHPGWHNPWVAFLFYMKAAEMDAATILWGNTLLAICVLGAAWAGRTARGSQLTWVLLLVPIPFYAYSVAYGSVPIFLPVWWPHSWYNLRYGLELLPAFALFSGFAAQFFLDSVRFLSRSKIRRPWAAAANVFLFTLIALNTLEMLREPPQVYMEGKKNMEARLPYERAIPPLLRAFVASDPNALILMNTSIDPEIVALAGISLRQTINESDLQVYRDALNAPSIHAGLVVAYDGDEIDNAIHAHPAGLRVLRRFAADHQPSITLYISDTSHGAALNKGAAAVIASLQETP